jgi:hypothetical protein
MVSGDIRSSAQEASSRHAHQTQPKKVQTTNENIPKVSIGAVGVAKLPREINTKRAGA